MICDSDKGYSGFAGLFGNFLVEREEHSCKMMYQLGNIFNTKLGLHICLCIMAVALVVVCGDKSFEDRDLTDRDTSEFRKVWELYILPRLEYNLRNRLNELEDINQQNLDELQNLNDFDDTEYSTNRNSRKKRISVAGLDNLDLMTKTLDRAKQFHLPMSVGGMSTNRLRMLMAAAGRRK